MFVNLTPHTINVFYEDGSQTAFPSEGCARVNQITEASGVQDGVTIYQTKFGAVEGLPAPQPGVFYIVSALVNSRALNRPDLLSPGNLVRDHEGRVIGCEGFIL